MRFRVSMVSATGQGPVCELFPLSSSTPFFLAGRRFFFVFLPVFLPQLLPPYASLVRRGGPNVHFPFFSEIDSFAETFFFPLIIVLASQLSPFCRLMFYLYPLLNILPPFRRLLNSSFRFQPTNDLRFFSIKVRFGFSLVLCRLPLFFLHPDIFFPPVIAPLRWCAICLLKNSAAQG